MKYTDKQIKNWEAYERVRSSGRYNMYDPRARIATGLSGKEYAHAMDNYEELQKQARPKP